MTDYGTYTVRPFSKSARPDLKDVFHVFLSTTIFQLKKIERGQFCALKLQNGQINLVQAWPAVEKIQDSVIQTSKSLQRIYAIRLGDKVSLVSNDKTITVAKEVTLCESSADLSRNHDLRIPESEHEHWAWLLESFLAKAEIIAPSLVFDDVTARGQRKAFEVCQVDGTKTNTLFRFEASTKVVVTSTSEADGRVSLKSDFEVLSDLTTDGLGGLGKQIERLNEELKAYGAIEGKFKMPRWYRPQAGGIILYGPSGTGKSLLQQRVSEAGWKRVFHLETEMENFPKGKVAAIRKTFAEARTGHPSLILIDDLEFVAGKKESGTVSGSTGESRALCKELERLGESKLLVLAATRSINDVDQILRTPHRFSVEIEVPVPTAKSRAAILKTLNGLSVEEQDPNFDYLAERTHGFVGADLYKLLQVAARRAKSRSKSLINQDTRSFESRDTEIDVAVLLEDYQRALREVRPSAMQEIFVETPEVRWSDIGGQEEIKKNLEKALIWPFRFQSEMKRFAVEPRKGLLLYGPPGCSKTMMARAAATESGHNFLAVKGAELLNMYVGESERAIRELFRKARSVSPSIVFFDEIDAIGSVRDEGHQSGLNVVTTLLNEIDGIEELKGVFVLAATNRPWVIDPALTRAGRLDTMLYVRPPDLIARKQILQKRVSLMDVADDVHPTDLALEMEGFSGAELVSICRRAGEAALEEQVDMKEVCKVSCRHFDRARTEVQKALTPEMLGSFMRFTSSTGMGGDDD